MSGATVSAARVLEKMRVPTRSQYPRSPQPTRLTRAASRNEETIGATNAPLKRKIPALRKESRRSGQATEAPPAPPPHRAPVPVRAPPPGPPPAGPAPLPPASRKTGPRRVRVARVLG